MSQFWQRYLSLSSYLLSYSQPLLNRFQQEEIIIYSSVKTFLDLPYFGQSLINIIFSFVGINGFLHNIKLLLCFHLQMLLHIIKCFKGNVSDHSNLCFRFLCLLLCFIVQTFITVNAPILESIMPFFPGIYSTRLPSFCNLVFGIFTRDETRKELLPIGSPSDF